MSNRIFIVILNWNGFSNTKECIENLFNSDYKDIKIVLVDNGSDNQEGQRLKELFSEIILISNKKNEGFCRGNNIGIGYCLDRKDCGLIMILNNDTTVDRNFLNPLVDHLKNNPLDIVSPKTLYYSDRKKVQTLGGKLFLGGVINLGRGKRSNKFHQPIRPDSLSGVCLMARREIFQKVGLFDESFFAYLEDLDWSWRARQQGFNLLTLPKSVIYHKYSQSSRGSLLKVFLIARNNIYFAKKHLKGFKKYGFILSSISVGFFLNIVRYKNLGFLKIFFKGIKEGIAYNLLEIHQ